MDYKEEFLEFLNQEIRDNNLLLLTWDNVICSLKENGL